MFENSGCVYFVEAPMNGSMRSRKLHEGERLEMLGVSIPQTLTCSLFSFAHSIWVGRRKMGLFTDLISLFVEKQRDRKVNRHCSLVFRSQSLDGVFPPLVLVCFGALSEVDLFVPTLIVRSFRTVYSCRMTTIVW